MKNTQPTAEPSATIELPELNASPRKFFKLYMFWQRAKNFFPELYYAFTQYYFVQRFTYGEGAMLQDIQVKSIEAQEFLAVKEDGKKFDFTIYPRHATVFTFIVGAIYVWLLNWQKNKPANISYAMVSFADVAFMHEVFEDEKLFPQVQQQHPNSVLAVSPVVLFGLTLILAGIIVLLQYYLHR